MCVCEWLSCLFAESPKKKKSSKSKHRSKESREGSVPPAVDPPSEGTGGGVNGIVASPEREGAPPTEGEWGKLVGGEILNATFSNNSVVYSYHLLLLSMVGGDKALIASATAFKELQKQR